MSESLNVYWKMKKEIDEQKAEIERLKQLISDRELLLTIEGTKALEKERDAIRTKLERVRELAMEYCDDYVKDELKELLDKILDGE